MIKCTRKQPSPSIQYQPRSTLIDHEWPNLEIKNNTVFFAGRGVVELDEVFLFSSSFMSDPPTFTLFGNTSGGPPTAYTWARNGQVITNNASYTTAIQVNQGAGACFAHSLYRSTLTVTGVLPGVYQYSVTNRATSGMVTYQINIEGIIIYSFVIIYEPFF